MLLLSSVLGLACSAGPRAALLPGPLPTSTPEIVPDHETEIDPERVRLTREYFEIHNPSFASSLPDGDDADALRIVPRVIVVHYTAIPTLRGTLEAFATRTIGSYRETIRENGLLNVGIQFVVDRDGTIYRLYPEDVASRHTIGLNHVAIGIENVGDGDLGSSSTAPLTEAQLASNVELVRYLAARHPSIDFLIGHSEYRELESPAHPAHGLFHEELPTYRTEKSDPGRRFLKRLRRGLRKAAAEGR